MAELSTRVPGTWALTWLLVRSRVRAQLQYRTSFVADLFGQVLLVPLEFVEIYALLHAAPVFGGMTYAQACLLFGISTIAFALADMTVGQLDSVNKLIKDGRLEVLLTRPASLLLQLITQDVQLRRLGRGAVGLGIYLWAIVAAHVALTPAHLALLVLAPLGGAVIFSALFLFAAGTLFFILDGNQAVNAFTYGGRYAAQVPGAALLTPVKLFFTFAVPATLIGYVPAAVLTGVALPWPWWPGTAWLTLPLGVVMWVVLLGYWRLAIRHYTGAGG